MRTLIAIPYIGRFYLADTISALGDYALWLALGIRVRELTGSSAAAALVLFAYSAGNGLSALLGRLIDHFPRKTLLLVTYPATAVLLTALLAVHDRDEVWIVYAVMLLYGLSGGLTAATQATLVPLLLGDTPTGRSLLGQANGLQQTLRTSLRLLSPALGAGILVTLGAPAVALMDAATFLLATALIASIPIPPNPATTSARAQQDAELDSRTATPYVKAGRPESGFTFLRTHPVLGPITAACAAGLLVISFSNALTFEVATTVLHHTASFVAVLTTMQGLGALLGGPSAAPLLRRLSTDQHGETKLMSLALAGAFLATVLRAIPTESAVLAGNILIGAAIPWLLVAAITAVQTHTPDRIRGRVIAAASLAASLPQLLGQAIGATLITMLPYTAICTLVALVLGSAATALAWHTQHAPNPTPALDPN
jgi:MFS family permease